MEIALFGGSFNPPHIGHVLVGTWLVVTRQVERVWVVPTHAHPFDKDLATFDDRATMCELAFAFLSPEVEVSRVEEELDGPSYTVRLVDALRKRHPEHTWQLVVGSDLLEEMDQWHEAERLRDTVPITVVRRTGYDTEDESTPEFPRVSSTLVRQRLADGRSVDALIPAGVLDYIRSKGLYDHVES